MAFPMQTMALAFYASILVGLGVGVYLMNHVSTGRRDWEVVGLGLVLALVAGALGVMGILGLQEEILLAYLPFFTIIPAGIVAWKARETWGGDIARYLEIIAIGFFLLGVTYLPHLYWHFQELTAGSLPEWGLSTNFWYVGFHGLSLFGIAYISYGFYLFWKGD